MGGDRHEMSSGVGYGQERGEDPMDLEESFPQLSDFLAARESLIKYLCSAQTIEESGDMVMELYCSRAGYKERKGKMRDAPPFSHIEAALYLMMQSHCGAGLTLEGEGRSSMHAQWPGTPPSRPPSVGNAKVCDGPMVVGVATVPENGTGRDEADDTVPFNENGTNEGGHTKAGILRAKCSVAVGSGDEVGERHITMGVLPGLWGLGKCSSCSRTGQRLDRW